MDNLFTTLKYLFGIKTLKKTHKSQLKQAEFYNTYVCSNVLPRTTYLRFQSNNLTVIYYNLVAVKLLLQYRNIISGYSYRISLYKVAI